jgi:hypothetical protein
MIEGSSSVDFALSDTVWPTIPVSIALPGTPHSGRSLLNECTASYFRNALSSRHLHEPMMEQEASSKEGNHHR